MQHRMKQYPLDNVKIEKLLLEMETASFATVNSNGFPYVTPVHFLYWNEHIYIHGLPAGQKIENIKNSHGVSMTVYKMNGLAIDPDNKPCNTNTNYESVIIMGTASMLNDMEQKRTVLNGFVEKYTPQLAGHPLPEQMIRGTGVIEVSIEEMTGKYY